MEAVILKCPVGGQFHFGKIGLDVDTSLDATSYIFHSDSLAGAIMDTAYRVLNEDKAERFKSYFEKGELAVSSVFYCLKIKGQWVFFLPKPVHFESLDNEDPKAVRDVLFISKMVWEEGLTPVEWKHTCFILQEKFVVHKAEIDGMDEDAWKKIDIFNENTLPKVAIHKPTRENSLYFQTNVQLGINRQTEIHLYFLMENKLTGADREDLNTVLFTISLDGIGGERSVGCGSLVGLEPPMPFSTRAAKPYYCSVSLICPTEADLAMVQAAKVITRGGRRTARDGKLQRLKMLAEGALLTGEPIGSLHDIADYAGKEKIAHPYHRSGMAMCLPFDYKKPAT